MPSWNLFFLGVSNEALTFFFPPSFFSIISDTVVKVCAKIRYEKWTYLRVNLGPWEQVLVENILDQRGIRMVGAESLAQAEKHTKVDFRLCEVCSISFISVSQQRIYSSLLWRKVSWFVVDVLFAVKRTISCMVWFFIALRKTSGLVHLTCIN